MQMNHIGQRIEEHSRYMFIMAHLYKAYHLKNPAMPTWPDMEIIIHRQGADRLFGGEAPNSLNNAFQKLLQACGYPAMSYNEYQKLRGDADKASGDTKQVRRLEDLSPLSKHGFYTQESRTTDSPDKLQSDLFITLQAPDLREQLTKLCLFRPGQTSANLAVWQDEWSTTEQDGRSEWLGNIACLDTWMRADSLKVNFDIFAVHSVCAKIWTATLTTLKSSPNYTFPASIDLENNPLSHQALALDILGKASTGDTAALGILAEAIENIILEPCTPSKQHSRKVWNGDRSLAAAIIQGAKQGIQYPVGF
ncbi:hypothetical protein PtrSN002B_009370 [Pyrenophora tritici-repentis]|uniref:Uncharacterized protein n=2 Tax=Pyrenophora tritici-repentis TaxID=45151 RepID=A0A2W1HEC3_9PLEO|nr:uncharacterized protein PTRG_05055 [Pyrenophora tritici-repentis Pt-1C-BFP]KAA8611802.1 hypothetical protein PtrV1_13678 [Pyrenophora tritici-repentis]EDU47962.1 predicted protein [Pyrenophora tritici-repentis Pt-1C-BFP]KAF7447293.1 hypothetical protein A1F99_087400 [Pyrenophora tritici-repentis]KAF7569656.1 hypothetical protein PtrM4_120710 [Pyrenophora tritici-repentis]KAG9382614.1 hypothetical protein A1F94_006535 [Pyrenophora tritici-repentis]